jgi:hypothetical protein
VAGAFDVLTSGLQAPATITGRRHGSSYDRRRANVEERI